MAGESIRDYFVRFLFKTDKDGATRAEQQIDRLKKGFDRLGKAADIFNEVTAAIDRVTAPFRRFGSMVDRTAEEADALQDLSERTGIATDALEEYAFMADLTGTSQEAMVAGMRVLEKQMGEAAGGSKEAAKAFADAGINIHGANRKLKTTEELLPEIAAHIQKLPSHAQKTAAAMSLLGRSGQELLPFLERAPAEIAAMAEELRLLGGVTDDEFLQASAEYADNVHRLTAAWKGIRQAISGPIIGMINQITGAFLSWWKASGALIRSKISEWFFQLTSSLKAFWDLLVRVAGPLLAFAAALNAPLLVMIGMKALLALLIDDFAHWMDGHDSLIGRAIANWDAWLSKVKETHPILGAALEAFGNFVQGAHDAIKGLFAFFDDLIRGFLKGGWRGFLDELVASFKAAFANMTDTLKGFFGLNKSSTIREAPTAAPTMHGQNLWPSVGGASSESNVVVSAPTSVTINAPAGSDAREIGREAGRAVREAQEAMLRASHANLVPEAY